MTPLEHAARITTRELADLETQIMIWETKPPEDLRSALAAMRAKSAQLRTGLIQAERRTSENVVAFGHDPFEQDTRIL